MPIEYVGQWRMEYSQEDGKLHRVTTQPTETQILEHNQELRRNPGVLKDLSFGRCQLIIPDVVMEQLRRDNPELGPLADAQTRTRWWQRFAASTASAPYRVR